MNLQISWQALLRKFEMLDSNERKKLFARAGRIVVKVGTNVIAEECARLSTEMIACIASQTARLVKQGREICIVSSGAITAGMGALGMKCLPRTIPEEQAAAAVGQSILMGLYSENLSRFGIKTAQILLTQGDLRDRKRYLNARNTMMTLLRRKVVPVVNENDTVAVDELVFGDRFGDNDMLSALVANLIDSGLLVMLTTVEGLYGEDGVIPFVDKVTPGIESFARDEKSMFGRGGMESKIRAARIVTDSGETAVIADGRRKEALLDIISGKETGTVFLPAKSRTGSRKRWIAYTLQPKGSVTVDGGAAGALNAGKSLLPGGITGCSGFFRKGDAVSVVDCSGKEIARGLANYSSDETERIMGMKTSQIREILGEKPYDEIIHRDNLTVLCRVGDRDAA